MTAGTMNTDKSGKFYVWKKKGGLAEFPLLFDGTEVAFFLKKRAKIICLKTLNMYRFVKTPWYGLTLI